MPCYLKVIFLYSNQVLDLYDNNYAIYAVIKPNDTYYTLFYQGAFDSGNTNHLFMYNGSIMANQEYGPSGGDASSDSVEIPINEYNIVALNRDGDGATIDFYKNGTNYGSSSYSEVYNGVSTDIYSDYWHTISKWGAVW